ncbi:MAG: SDR family oxidoreductase [Clostridiales bacterium]|nr:SDR family oxidoreductase [Clostridiales bacterium]HBM81640.1 short-chain dehydrogenase [Clostridiaceae bacterium]
MENKNRVALVTGAGRGIGKAIALEFAANGYDVVIHHRKEPEGAAQLAGQIMQMGRKAQIVTGDLTCEDVPYKVVDDAYKTMGRLDVLVNNAGATISGPFLQMPFEELERCYKLDFRAAYLCAQRAARLMVDTGTKGSIINITSVHQERVNDRDSVYSSMKSALARATESMAYELAPYGIRVNAVEPGRIQLVEPEGKRKAFVEGTDKSIPLRRSGRPVDVAKGVVWLASCDADYITGATLRIDGGLNIPMMRALYDGKQYFI